jgi:glucuronide carrier protein
VSGIQLAAGAIPAALTILAVLVMSKYKLTDAMHAEILTEIRARRVDGENSNGGAAGTEPSGADPAAKPLAANSN